MQEVLELTASRDVQQTSEWYFVDKLIHTELNRKRIGLGHGVGYLEDLLLENQDPKVGRSASSSSSRGTN